MASASTATMAAAGFDKRASSAASSLQTPASGSFPSEMLSPMAPSPSFLKREDALKTPITPPSAYLDFLKNMTPSMMSPASTGTSSRFSFNDRPGDKASGQLSEPRSALLSPPTSQPALSRNQSYDSNKSNASTAPEPIAPINTYPVVSARRASKPESPHLIIPPSQFAKPASKSARTPRRLNIPQSPYSPAKSSATAVPSPYAMSSTPLSATPWSASYSPNREHHAEASAGQAGKVSVRHVVTRTVTYCRTPLEPAPKGKRRKIEEMASAKDSSDEPPIKQEKLDDVPERAEDSALDTDTTESSSVSGMSISDVDEPLNSSQI